MTMTTCPHLRDDGVCSIAATLLPGVEPHANESACAFCSTKASEPRAVNRATIGITLLAIRKRSLPIEQVKQFIRTHVLTEAENRLQSVKNGRGVGSELWRLLESLGVRHTSTCSCIALAQQLNDWGHAGCRLARAEIVERMRNNAQTYGWGTIAKAAGLAIVTGVAWKINPLDPYGSLLDEAIRRAAAASVP